MSPDRSQFYRYDTISLSCEGHSNSTGWKVVRNTSEAGVRTCSSSWGFISSSSACIFGNIYPTDSGVYWCESADGEKSNGVNITITDRLVLLESPGLPVSEGAAVTLRCKAETNSSDLRFDFSKDGLPVSINSTGEMIIHSASKSDEGLYKCSIHGGEESLGSWLAVQDRLVLLESPGLPVSEGAAVTLRCKAKMSSSDLRFDFSKDGLPVSINSTGEMIIHSASKSDEGLYKCSIHGGEESLGSWLAVQGEINGHVHTDGVL
ncbi:Fc receptor-like protein 5 [Pagrus major]|uniref:Fc receptor-like protein 5 n=1 Tax=Pagrus major TaxID=143350 RepID=UPI003CC8AED0